MAQVKRFTAKKAFRLDCGHTVKPGESFVVTKFFACEADGNRLLIQQKMSPPKAA